MTSADLERLYKIVKHAVDTDGHYLTSPKRRILTHSVIILLELQAIIRIAEEAKNFQTCVLCKAEIDLRYDGVPTGNNGGGVIHKVCPPLKPPDDRNEKYFGKE